MPMPVKTPNSTTGGISETDRAPKPSAVVTLDRNTGRITSASAWRVASVGLTWLPTWARKREVM